MRTTVTIEDALIDDARETTGIKETPTLIRMGLKLLVQQEASRRLAQMGGTQPDLSYPPRRRPPNFMNGESTYPETGAATEPPKEKRRAAS